MWVAVPWIRVPSQGSVYKGCRSIQAQKGTLIFGGLLRCRSGRWNFVEGPRCSGFEVWGFRVVGLGLWV